MKKISVVIGIFIATFPLISYASFDQNLSYGMEGKSVFELQDILQEDGCLSVTSNGYFGLNTLKGVKCWQSKNGITATGFVGSLTRAALNKVIDSNIADSIQAQSAEPVTVNPSPTTPNTSPACPIGFNCTPASQVNADNSVQSQQRIALLQTTLNQVLQNQQKALSPQPVAKAVSPAPSLPECARNGRILNCINISSFVGSVGRNTFTFSTAYGHFGSATTPIEASWSPAEEGKSDIVMTGSGPVFLQGRNPSIPTQDLVLSPDKKSLTVTMDIPESARRSGFTITVGPLAEDVTNNQLSMFASFSVSIQ